jgi:hypothetical protein
MKSAQAAGPLQITGDMSVAEIIHLCPNARRIFDEHGLKGCGGEHGPAEPLSFFAGDSRRSQRRKNVGKN